LRPEKKPHAREQVQLASSDSLWQHVPPGWREHSRFTVLGDAAWVPWGEPTTSVGRYYRRNRHSGGDTSAWREAATGTGWRAEGNGCAAETSIFAKQLGSWPATLTIGPDATSEYLNVVISFDREHSGTSCHRGERPPPPDTTHHSR
jgi:hypothetical protein